MSKRPSLADSLRASLTKGVHVDTAEKIARGLAPISDIEPPSPIVSPVIVADPVVQIEASPVIVSEPVIADLVVTGVSLLSAEQSIEQSGKQSNKQAPDRAELSANNQTSNQTNNITDKQTDTQASTTAIEQTEKQSIQQDSKQPDKQPSRQTTEQSTKQATEQPLQQAIEHSQEQSIKQSSRHAWLPLNENQGRILMYLYERGNGLTNMDIVCAETLIAYGTARTAIDVLMKEGYVTNKVRHNGHAFRGFEYALNNHLCSLYISRIKGEQSGEQSSWQSIKQLSNQTIGQTSKQTVGSFSSSSLEEKPTTTEPRILNEPELRYWAGEGVTEKQVQTWMTEFQMTPEEIALSLRYGRFDILERGDVQSAANWFYKILTRNGFYPKPTNYRSLLEIKAEVLKKQQEADNEAKEKIEASEFEIHFKAFVSEPASPLFKHLYEFVSNFSKEEYKSGEKSHAETELRDLLKRHLAGEKISKEN